MKIRAMVTKIRTDGRTDMTQLIVGSCNFPNVPNIQYARTPYF